MGAITAPTLSAAKQIALSITLVILATVAVVLRVISTRIRRKAWQSHDFLCMFSYVSYQGPFLVDDTDGGDSSVWLGILLIISLVGRSDVPAQRHTLSASLTDFVQVCSMVVWVFTLRNFR